MISINEIYLLNLILDKKDIFPLLSLQDVAMPTILLENEYKSLINKEILYDEKTLTKKGAKLVKCIQDYKNSIKYAKIGTLIVGLYEKEKGIALLIDLIHGLYSFKRINVNLDAMEIIKVVPFLNNYDNGESGFVEKISYDDLNQKIRFKRENSVFLSTFDKKIADFSLERAITNEIIFYYKNSFYIYNRQSEELFIRKREDCINILKERLII